MGRVCVLRSAGGSVGDVLSSGSSVLLILSNG